MMNIQEIFERQHKSVYRIAMLMLNNQADAEDAVQNIFIKYYEKGIEFNDIEHEKGFLPLLMGHVFKGIQRSQRPQNRHQASKHHAHSVNPEGNGKVIDKMHHMEGFRHTAEQQRPHNAGGQQHHCPDVKLHLLPFSKRKQRNSDTSQNRQHNGSQNPILTHTFPPLTAHRPQYR